MFRMVIFSVALAVAAAPCGIADAQVGDVESRSLAARRTPVVAVVEQARDSIVSISSTISVRRPRTVFDDIFHRPNLSQTTKVGSGFVIHEHGYLVTNSHVVTGAADLTVTFADGSEYQAEIVSWDTTHDLAVLKIEPDRPIRPIPLGHSDDLMIGETAIAIGNPLGYQNTVTTGVISAVDRKLEFPNGLVYTDLIQTDASINAGNSGGPLLNILGQLIGINTAIRGDAQNIGFAIPVDHLRKLLPEMLHAGKLHNVNVGMRVGGGDDVRVVGLTDGGPAQRAGVRVGDVVERIDGRPVRRDIDFYIAMLERRAGDQVRLDLASKNRSRHVQLVLGELRAADGARLARKFFGLQLVELADQAARRYGITADRGLMVIGVEPGTPAERSDVQVGDLLVEVEATPVRTLPQIGYLLESVSRGDPVNVEFWRSRGRNIYGLEKQLRAQ
ncbi:MAG: trypsin-like peptidase domain-containing protein [Planctomycetes bacterium]|nr:trypsin-like peptidase domain-containing protein [Planctomycetota bacterium]